MADWESALGCLVFPAVVAIAWAVIAALRARREARSAVDGLAELRSRVFDLERRLETARPERAAEIARLPSPALPIPAPPAERPIPAAQSIFAPPRAPEAPRPAAPPTPAFDWESVIGVKLFAWLGGGALFLAAALFLQYSIQHDLISPRTRVAIGLIVGAAAIGFGGPVGRRASRAGQAIAGAGAAILYAALYAAHAVYHLISAGAATAAMAAVTALAGFLAVKRNAFMLAILALVGGFATPALLSTGEDRALSLLVYTALLDAGIVLVARRRRWDGLSLLGVFGSAVLFTGWATQFLDPGRVGAAMIAAGALGAIFVFSSADRASSESPSRAVGTSAAGLLFALAVSVAPSTELRVPPAFLVGYLLVLCAGAWWIASERRAERVFPAAAAATIGALVLRVGPDLFPSRRIEALALFAAVPAAFAGAALLARRGAIGRRALSGAVIALGGTLLVLARIADVEPAAATISSEAAFAAFVVAVGLAIGAASRDGRWAIGAEAYAFLSLSLFLNRCSPGRLAEFLPAIVAPGLFFWALPFVAPALREGSGAWFAAAASPVLFYSVLYAEARESWGATSLGVLAIALGVLAFGSLRKAVALAAGDPSVRRGRAALFGAASLFFGTAAIPILLEKQWITIAWSLEAAALAWLFTRVPHDGLVAASAALAAAAFVRLLFNPALWTYQPRTGTPVLNWYLYVFAIPAAAFLAASRWARASERARLWRYPAILTAAAGILFFVLVNVEIADFYSTGSALLFRLTGGGLAEDMTYSLAWGVFGVVLLVVGIRARAKPARAAALGVLLLTIGKVFLHDLWSLGSLYRVGSIVALAISLLAVSFLTQRFVLAREPEA